MDPERADPKAVGEQSALDGCRDEKIGEYKEDAEADEPRLMPWVKRK